MQDVEDTADAASDLDRQSRRDRWKDALSKTKSKWKKEKVVPQLKQEFKLSDDVNDFLAAGRKAAVTATIQAVQPVDQRQSSISPRPSTGDSTNAGQPSPRGVPVPKLDVSQSRYPQSRSVHTDPRSRSDDHLTPDYNDRRQHDRSHSFNSALKKRAKSRGLSVTFVDSPPVVIGEGGDAAEAPTYEIFKARQRSRSLSPYVERPTSMYSNNSNNSNSRSPVRRKPLPPPSPPGNVVTNSERQDSVFQPKPMRRIQTGFNGMEAPSPVVEESFSMQLQKALNLGGEAEIKNTIDDPRVQQRIVPPPPVQEFKPPPPNRLSGTEFKPVMNRQSPTNVQDMHHPDLQQSIETSHKPPPPKVRNYYAEINQRQQSPDDRRQSPNRHAGDGGVKPYLQPSPIVEGRQRSDQFDIQQAQLKRSQTMPHETPGGWI